MALIPPIYMDAVASIGVRNGKSIVWIGTGFFVVKHIEGNQYQPLFITNRHVVENKDLIVIRLKETTSNQLTIVDLLLKENGRNSFSVHDDQKIDIAAILLNGGAIIENNLKFSAFDIDKNAMSSDELVQEGCDEGSFIYMLGYPMGLVDIDSNMPICRVGCLARIDQAEITRTKQMLADVQNFPGNSGSPIITKPEMVHIDGTKSLGKSVLAGIVHGYIPYEEQLINAQTKRVVEIRSENSGIAVVHPVEFIREVVNKEMKRSK